MKNGCKILINSYFDIYDVPFNIPSVSNSDNHDGLFIVMDGSMGVSESKINTEGSVINVDYYDFKVNGECVYVYMVMFNKYSSRIITISNSFIYIDGGRADLRELELYNVKTNISVEGRVVHAVINSGKCLYLEVYM